MNSDLPRAAMANFKILIFKFGPVDTFSASAIEVGKVSSLAHETGDDPMKDTFLVSKAHFATAEFLEIIHCLWYNSTVQTHFNTTSSLSIDCNIEEDGIGDIRIGLTAAKQTSKEVANHGTSRRRCQLLALWQGRRKGEGARR